MSRVLEITLTNTRAAHVYAEKERIEMKIQAQFEVRNNNGPMGQKGLLNGRPTERSYDPGHHRLYRRDHVARRRQGAHQGSLPPKTQAAEPPAGVGAASGVAADAAGNHQARRTDRDQDNAAQGAIHRS